VADLRERDPATLLILEGSREGESRAMPILFKKRNIMFKV